MPKHAAPRYVRTKKVIARAPIAAGATVVGIGVLSVPAQAAFAAHTVGGWRAAGRTAEGVLQPGAPATFAVWETAGADPFQLAPEAQLPSCLATVVRGVPIFDAGLLGAAGDT